jgi:Fic family protein
VDIADFSEEMQPRLVRGADRVLSFVPGPLPTTLHLSAGGLAALIRAENALGRLRGSVFGSTRDIHPVLLTAPLRRREAIISSRIEGTYTTPEQLALFELEPDDAIDEDTREVGNYLAALDHGLDRISTLPVSKRLILELHARLMQGSRGDRLEPGAWRTVPNFIGSSADIHSARFVPPPPDRVEQCLNDLERFIHEHSRDMPRLVRVALAHYQFEAIHPFRDGNGRVGRLLIPLLLASEEPELGELVYVSRYLEMERHKYFDLLLDVSRTGNYLPWVEFFVSAVAETALESIERAEALFALRQSYQALALQARLPTPLVVLLDKLFRRPIINVRWVVESLDVSKMTAAKYIQRLVELAILREVTGRQRHRRYLAQGILDVVYKD